MSGEYLLVMTTMPNQPAAEQLANKLVAQSLAACVNILPAMQSIYLWQGKQQNAQEHQLLIKTMQHCYTELQTFIQANHPYDVPEIISIQIQDGLPAYLNWLRACCEENT